ncbi:transporter [Flavobacterium sp. LS2P90]|uniref:Transporter n=2 Tax=Flavobacterium xylosi TaxID=3230415 RepID=A0ABW6HRU3_9FLAO
MIPCIHYGQHTDQINSNRPGETMSAFSVGKSVFQIETGIYGIKQNHSLLNYDANGFGIDATLRWGLFMEKLELIADLQYQNEKFTTPFNNTNRAALKQTVLGAKYLIYDPFKNYEKKVNVYSWKANRSFNWHQLIPAVSVFAGANFTMADNPYSFSPEANISPKIMLITQNHLGDGSWVFVTNIIADYVTTDYPSYGYVLTLTKGFSDKWSGFIENQGFKSDFYSDAILRGGAAYLLNKDMQIDASISTSLKNTPSVLYGGIGFSWRYDANYEEVRVNIDSGGDSGKKAARRAKKTKKG